MSWCVSSSYRFPHTVDVKLQRHSFWNFLLHFFHYCWSGRGGRWVQGPGSRRSESHAIKINSWITWITLVPDSWIFTNKVDHFISASFFEFSPIAFHVSEEPIAIPWVCPKNMNKIIPKTIRLRTCSVIVWHTHSGWVLAVGLSIETVRMPLLAADVRHLVTKA